MNLNRRTFLNASGVSLALPLLESMTPVYGAAAEVPNRMVFICATLGLHPDYFWPDTSGKEYESTDYLDVIKKHRDDFTVFSGLQHEGQGGRQPHDSQVTWLTAARGPGLGGFRNSISVDQVAAKRLGYVTRFPSISLGSNTSQSQSFTSSGVMVPAEASPANLFAKMFLQGQPEEISRQKQKLNDGRSILDELSSQTKQVFGYVSSSDEHRLEQYFESVRTAERNIAEAQGWIDRPKPSVAAKQPTDIADKTDFTGRVQLLMDLIPLIIQSDSSRVISVMIQDHGIISKVPGVSQPHHNLSHHGQDETKIAELKEIELRVMGCFDSLLTQMKEKREPGGTLLDKTSILFGSNLGNANAHDPRNLPVVLAGGGYDHGRFIARRKGNPTPLCNLFVRMLNDAGIETESFGQSTGTLSW